MSPWQPIESAPKDGTEVLVCDTVSESYDIAHWYDDWWYATDGGIVNPTHWQPLPPPPSDDAMGTPCAGGGS